MSIKDEFDDFLQKLKMERIELLELSKENVDLSCCHICVFRPDRKSNSTSPNEESSDDSRSSGSEDLSSKQKS